MSRVWPLNCAQRGVAVSLSILCVACLWWASSAQAATDRDTGHRPLIVFAAASLKNAMDDVARAFEASHPGADLRTSYAGSSTLARQIQGGAPADIYLSANQQWMNQLGESGLIDTASRYDLLGNSLVLIAPKKSQAAIRLDKHVDLLASLGPDNYLAMANTDAVPAGIYGRNALTWLGAWRGLQGHIAQAEDVRGALALVSRGESPLGVVYSSDAVADHGVRVVDTFPAASHKPIVYPVARVADSHNPQDDVFLAFLRGDQARQIFTRWGFIIVTGQ